MTTITPSPEYMQMIQSAAQAIVNSRELCGNEAQALKDWEADNGTLLKPDRELVWRHAARVWENYQACAKVTQPITPEERRAIARMMER